MANSGVVLKCLRQLSLQNIIPNICVVGAGPAGFYATQQILKVCKT
jgi:NADPH-dependent 2,4-dienoyl-CoA reductase/sulfur reductase-like enzyme